MTLLATFAEQFPLEESCVLWKAIESSPSHTDPEEKKAVARAIVKDILGDNVPEYRNAYYAQLESLHPGRPYAAYSLMLMSNMPKLAKRKSKKRTKTILGWVFRFLTETGETQLLEAFEGAIAHHLPK